VVLILPAGAGTMEDVSARLMTGHTDQSGRFFSATLAPGRYSVLAANRDIFPAPEDAAKLVNALPRFIRVELNPKETAQATLVPVSID
jgi:hypothetical protein